jgi:hypothetical protein
MPNFRLRRGGLLFMCRCLNNSGLISRPNLTLPCLLRDIEIVLAIV